VTSITADRAPVQLPHHARRASVSRRASSPALGVHRDDHHGGKSGPRDVWRAYSIVSADYDEYLEFYSIVVPTATSTTRLAQLRRRPADDREGRVRLPGPRPLRGRARPVAAVVGHRASRRSSRSCTTRCLEQYERADPGASVRQATSWPTAIPSRRAHARSVRRGAGQPGQAVYVPIVTPRNASTARFVPAFRRCWAAASSKRGRRSPRSEAHR